eukprot:3566707-Rhodomonas_salina.4
MARCSFGLCRQTCSCAEKGPLNIPARTGSGCYPGDKSISCSNIGECICRDFIHDTTKAFCTTLEV